MSFQFIDQERLQFLGGSVLWARPTRFILAGLLVGCLLGGCNKGAKPASLRGIVKVGGVPVAKGVVRLSTQDGTPGPGGLSPIKDGYYEVESCKGLKAGKYLVIILGFKETGRMIQIDDSNPPHKEELQFIPRRYNDDSREVIELLPGDNEKDFDLTT